MKNNVKKAWWKKFVQENPYNVGLDSAILMNPQTWVASGHLGGFSDPLMDCKECKSRHRADKLIEDFCESHNITPEKPVDTMTHEEMKAFVEEKGIEKSASHRYGCYDEPVEHSAGSGDPCYRASCKALV